jgi:hypothetical protein
MRTTSSSTGCPYTNTVMVSPTFVSVVVARSRLITASPGPGVSPTMPVAAGSPPKAAALGKSTSISCARGWVWSPVTATWVVTSGRTPSRTPSASANASSVAKLAVRSVPASSPDTVATSSIGPSWS